MNAGYYVGQWVDKLIKSKGKNGAIKTISTYVGGALAKKLVSMVIAKASTTAIGAAVGGKLGALAGPVGVGLAGLAGVL